MNIRKICICLACFTLLSASLSAGNGKGLYASKCQNCHGPNGKGNTPIAKSLGGVGDLTVSRSKKELFDITSNGRGKMPGYGKSLSTEKIKSIVDYIQTFSE